MPQGAAASAPPTIARDALRIVLLGLPQAGKSSLLAALAQAAQTQEHLLNGKLSDLSKGLGDLKRFLGQHVPNDAQGAPYPIAFETYAAGDRPGSRIEASFIDYDGKLASELLLRRDSLIDAGRSSALADAVLEADALVLAVDASSTPSQLDAEFAQFARFLRLLRQARSRRSEISGLPVFLVLTKCDLLAQPADTTADWIDRIEERKREVGQRFRDFMVRQSGSTHLPFGSLDLHLWATAIAHPPLKNDTERTRDPYGVAELFRQCLQSARHFRLRHRRATRRLVWTVGGTLGMVAVMVGLSATLLTNRHEPTSNVLSGKVAVYRSREGITPSSRLRGPLQRQLAELEEFKADPEFASLPPADQQYVTIRLQELKDYRSYLEKLQAVRVAQVRTEADLEGLRKQLTTGNLAIPQQYEAEWKQTEVVALHARLVKDVDAMRFALAETEDWYRQAIRQGEELRTFARNKPSDAPSWNQWQSQVQGLLGKTFPHSETEELPGSSSLSYAIILRIPRVVEARLDWESLRQRLEVLNDLVSALGMAGRLPNGERQPLDIPDRFTAAQARNFLGRLQTLYPRLHAEVETLELPDAIAEDVHHTAAISYDHLIDAGRAMVLDHLQQAGPNGQETWEAWRQLKKGWLEDPQDLKEWRALANVLGHLLQSDPGDPITNLAQFIGRDHFDIEIQRLTLIVPLERQLTVTGPLQVLHARAGNEPAPALVFRPNEGQRDPQRGVTTYTLMRDVGSVLDYRPGDVLLAEVPVKRTGVPGDWVLSWTQSRSEVYQFERLVRPPRLHLKDQEAGKGESLDDIRLEIVPEQGVPRVPDLVPVVKLRKS